MGAQAKNKETGEIVALKAMQLESLQQAGQVCSQRLPIRAQLAASSRAGCELRARATEMGTVQPVLPVRVTSMHAELGAPPCRWRVARGCPWR